MYERHPTIVSDRRSRSCYGCVETFCTVSDSARTSGLTTAAGRAPGGRGGDAREDEVGHVAAARQVLGEGSGRVDEAPRPDYGLGPPRL